MALPPGNAAFDASPLYRVAAELAGLPQSDVAAAGAVLLLPPRGGTAGPLRSTLNNDGTPLQICVTADRSGAGVKLIGDPGATAPSIAERLASGQAALAAVFDQTSCGTTAARILAATLPPSLTDYPEAANGIIWLGSAVGSSARAFYVKARWNDAGADWDKLDTLAGLVLLRPIEAQTTIAALRKVARPLSVGLETAGTDRARLKVYWRLEQPVALGSVGIGLLADAAFGDLLRSIVGARRISPAGLVFSVSFALANGSLCDVKLDICAHCVPRAPLAWLETIEALAAQHGLAVPAIGPMLEARRADIAFVGLGIDADGRKRLNVYLKAPDFTDTGRSLQ